MGGALFQFEGFLKKHANKMAVTQGLLQPGIVAFLVIW